MSFINPIITPALLDQVLSGYVIDVRGIHGIRHWQQVEWNTQALAEKEGVFCDVFALFALFHDSRRKNDGRDPGHGPRGAALAREFHTNGLLKLPDVELEQLCYACEFHTHQTHHADPVIGICWDADRLDLPRVGIKPASRFLNSSAAKEAAERLSNGEPWL